MARLSGTGPGTPPWDEREGEALAHRRVHPGLSTDREGELRLSPVPPGWADSDRWAADDGDKYLRRRSDSRCSSSVRKPF